ncbi:ABC transporter permease [Halomontanus rarus]|uniref:ABC transporter permease n=1 Tax=Halomontanus rarus TaxID=3034020 RepID=UPI00307BE9FA
MSRTDENRTTVDAPFDTVSERNVSQRERLVQLYDEWIYAPFKIIWTDWRARFGLVVSLLYLLMGTVGPYLISKPKPNQVERYLLPWTPSWIPGWSGTGELAYPLGADGLGQGLFRLMVHATPFMLQMITAGAFLSIFVGVAIGTVSGYKGGLTDRLLMTFTDMMLTIPGLPLLIVLTAILEPENPWLLGIILSINAWPGLARSLRSQVLTLREADYVEASRAMGVSTHNIVREDILPNVIPYILINMARAAVAIIYASVGLYFLGVLPFTSLNWGVVLNLAYTTGGSLYTLNSAHWLLVPMFTIVLFTFALILFAQGTDQIFNPRIRARHAKTIESNDEEDSEDEPVDSIAPYT